VAIPEIGRLPHLIIRSRIDETVAMRHHAASGCQSGLFFWRRAGYTAAEVLDELDEGEYR
jgi:hypothetical protein